MFPTNLNGGWDVPCDTQIPSGTVVPANSVIGTKCWFDDGCRIGQHTKVGEGCLFGDSTSFGDCCDVKSGVRIGRDAIIEEGVHFQEDCAIAGGSVIGNDCRFGADCKVGPYARIGDFVKFSANCSVGAHSRIGNALSTTEGFSVGSGTEIGHYTKIQKGATLEGVKMEAFMTLANVDGSCRQVLLVKHEGGVLVRAGCFLGTPEEFCAKALQEGKHAYAAVIDAIVKVWCDAMEMKMKPEHFQQLKEAFSVLDTEAMREAYRKGKFPRAIAVKDLDKRYRWDLFLICVRGYKLSMQALYAYLNDDHIDTALRKLVKPL